LHVSQPKARSGYQQETKRGSGFRFFLKRLPKNTPSPHAATVSSAANPGPAPPPAAKMNAQAAGPASTKGNARHPYLSQPAGRGLNLKLYLRFWASKNERRRFVA